MTPLFWLSYAILWLFAVILVFLVLLLYRQFGLQYMGPRRRLELGGLDVNTVAPPVTIAGANGAASGILSWELDDPDGDLQLVIFGGGRLSNM